MGLRAINAHTATFFVIVVLAFETASSYLFLASANFSLSTFFDPVELFERGERGATLLRWASILSAAGYLAAIPLALYLRNRFREDTAIGGAALAGILFLTVGAIGGVLMAGFGAPLVAESATDYKGIFRDEFRLLHGFVVFGIWQTIDPVLAGLWLIPTGLAARRHGATVLAVVLIGVAVVGLAVLFARLIGLPPGIWPA